MTGAQANLASDPRAALRDPAYFALHLKAVAAIREVDQLCWYDSHFLRRFEVAKRYLAGVRPDALAEFVELFSILLPRDGFREIVMDDVFDAATRDEIIAVSRAAKPKPTSQQDKENAKFGRHVLWDIPFYLDLQEKLRPLVSELVGRPLVSSYNFLSLYGSQGRCDLHMDHVKAMYTFDYCIEQDAVWPIYLSRVVDWPTNEEDFNPARIMADPDLDFREHWLQPDRALLFNGSSQWHYRNPKAAGGFCNLLFFHYYPEGCEALVNPVSWADHSGITELGPLCDLFHQPGRDGFP